MDPLVSVEDVGCDNGGQQQQVGEQEDVPVLPGTLARASHLHMMGIYSTDTLEKSQGCGSRYEASPELSVS